MVARVLALVFLSCMVLAENVPYQFSMELGRTYNLGTDQVGVDIVDANSDTKVVDSEENFDMSSYAVVQTAGDVRQLLHLGNLLYLKAQYGITQVRPFSAYLSKNVLDSSSVEVLIYSVHFTKTSVLYGVPNPVEICKTMSSSVLGTHYVRTKMFGASAVGSIKIYPTKNTTYGSIISAVQRILGNSGDLSFSTEKMRNLELRFSTKHRIDLSAYGTDGQVKTTSTISGLINMLTKSLSERKPVPILAELVPLNMLPACKDLPSFQAEYESIAPLDDVASRLEELRGVEHIMTTFMEKLPSSNRITADHWSQMKSLISEIRRLQEEFIAVIRDLDIGHNSSANVLDKAMGLYFGENSRSPKLIYLDKWLKLKNAIETGGWCSWGNWTKCGATCGNSFQERERKCECPKPMGNSTCEGKNKEMKSCGNEKCPLKRPVIRCEQSEFANSYNRDLHYSCPGVITGVYSHYDAAKQDRRWSYGCCWDREASNTTIIKKTCLGVTNYFSEPIDAKCPNGSFISNIRSIFSDMFISRMWAMECAGSDRISVDASKCHYEEKLLNSEFGQLIEYRAPKGWAVAGWKGIALESKKSGRRGDRAWRVWICPYTWNIAGA